MKVRIIKPFRDKYTKVVYMNGQEIEVTNERYEEINSAALGPFVERSEQKKSDVAKKPEKPASKKPTTKTTKKK